MSLDSTVGAEKPENGEYCTVRTDMRLAQAALAESPFNVAELRSRKRCSGSEICDRLLVEQAS